MALLVWMCQWWPTSVVAKLGLLDGYLRREATRRYIGSCGEASFCHRRLWHITSLITVYVSSRLSLFNCTVWFLASCLLMQTDSMFSRFKDKVMQRCPLPSYPSSLVWFVLLVFLKAIKL